MPKCIVLIFQERKANKMSVVTFYSSKKTLETNHPLVVHHFIHRQPRATEITFPKVAACSHICVTFEKFLFEKCLIVFT